MAGMKQVLHVGCGAAAPGKLHPAFRGEGWRETRLDIDADVQPDIVASITDMSGVHAGEVDAVFSSHNLEHLYPHQVQPALREFRRVLKPGGVALITLPDVQAVAQMVAEGGLTEAAYMSPLGPITPLDMLYGYRPALAREKLFMAHHTGFSSASLLAAMSEAGFAYSLVQRNPTAFCLWAIGFATLPTETEIEDAQYRLFPLHAALRAQREMEAALSVHAACA